MELFEIKDIVSEYFGFDISTSRKNLIYCEARWIYFNLAYKYATKKSMANIGKTVNRNHSSVTYGLREHEKQLSYSKQFKINHENIEAIVKNFIEYNIDVSKPDLDFQLVEEIKSLKLRLKSKDGEIKTLKNKVNNRTRLFKNSSANARKWREYYRREKDKYKRLKIKYKKLKK